jgi:hypothetical protein
MLAWALQTAELAAKEGMAATKLGGLSALLQVSTGGAMGATGAASSLPPVIRGKARAIRSAP